MSNLTMYVNQLPETTQNAIRSDLIDTLKEYLRPIEITEAIEDAMCSRLCDLSNRIDINKYMS